MNNELLQLQPSKLWQYFRELTLIPRPSRKEAQSVEFVKSFAAEHKLAIKVDEVGNVLLSKPATPGYENRTTVILQAHLDMVPQKNSATRHDFEKDPIQTLIDGDWVKANGTTLGADNGIGVAAALAVLTDPSVAHGPIEVLLTIDEETGMTGAFNLKPGFFTGDILMNLDSEEEGELCIGCAGGMNTTATFTYKPEPVPAGYKAYQISLTGLKGGHSGVDIHLGRGNANKLMNRLLWQAANECGLRLASIEGGSLRNAIPRESFALVVVPDTYAIAFEALVKASNELFRSELTPVEPDLQLKAEKASTPARCFDIDSQKALLSAVYALPNGVIRMTADMPDVVETSTNLAIVKSDETNGVVTVKCLLRSAVDSAKKDLGVMMESVFSLAGATTEHDGAYPGWKPDVNSPILTTMIATYKKQFGKEPMVKVIHAGLECGIIGDVKPGLDMVSVGPTICFPHSPDEKVNIPSVQKFWDYLQETLKQVPVRS